MSVKIKFGKNWLESLLSKKIWPLRLERLVVPTFYRFPAGNPPVIYRSIASTASPHFTGFPSITATCPSLLWNGTHSLSLYIDIERESLLCSLYFEYTNFVFLVSSPNLFHSNPWQLWIDRQSLFHGRRIPLFFPGWCNLLLGYWIGCSLFMSRIMLWRWRFYVLFFCGC